MAINQQQQQYQRTGFDLTQLIGTGASTWSDDVTAVLVSIEPREGFYAVTDGHGSPVPDPKTGQQMMRPNTWVAHFDDGSMFNWTVFVNEQTGAIEPWSRFDQSINLAQCAAQGIPVHVWRDERKRMHLELAESQPAQQMQQVMGMAAQPARPAQPVNAYAAPWQQ